MRVFHGDKVAPYFQIPHVWESVENQIQMLRHDFDGFSSYRLSHLFHNHHLNEKGHLLSAVNGLQNHIVEIVCRRDPAIKVVKSLHSRNTGDIISNRNEIVQFIDVIGFPKSRSVSEVAFVLNNYLKTLRHSVIDFPPVRFPLPSKLSIKLHFINVYLFATFDDQQDQTFEQELPTIFKVLPFQLFN
jgi:hypothetical protein